MNAIEKRLRRLRRKLTGSGVAARAAPLLSCFSRLLSLRSRREGKGCPGAWQARQLEERESPCQEDGSRRAV
jgi:hypothetical protein